jgi:hypothetical protein
MGTRRIAGWLAGSILLAAGLAHANSAVVFPPPIPSPDQALFNPSLVTPLCDGNGDGRCDVKDILVASLEIYSPGQTATCGRFPFLP